MSEDNNTETPATNTITIDDLIKVDMRIGTIRSAESVPKSELLKMEVSFGELGTRTILARIATSFATEAVVGLQVVAVLNLPPRKMKGIESQGMLFAAERSDGIVALIQPSAVVPDGSPLR